MFSQAIKGFIKKSESTPSMTMTVVLSIFYSKHTYLQSFQTTFDLNRIFL